MTVLFPVGDGLAVGDWQVVGGVDRFAALNPALGDDSYVQVQAMPGTVLDVFISATGPIQYGDARLIARLSRIGSDAEVHCAVTLWGMNPGTGAFPAHIAEMGPLFVNHDDWRDYVLPVIGRDADRIASGMRMLWLRLVVITVANGVSLPTLRVSTMMVDAPDDSKLTFYPAGTLMPAEGELVTVRTFNGRTSTAKILGGEWVDAGGLPFELDRHSLPLDAAGRYQQSREVNGWYGPLGAYISDALAVTDNLAVIKL